MTLARAAKTANKAQDYSAFEQLDGRHPWQEKVPEGAVLYPVRQLEFGKILYFNFELAKEMGLIGTDHENKLNPALSEMLLATFNLRIVNEYDQKRKTNFPRHLLKPNPYMATRYLQLQHSNKKGSTSGDGRSIWNGVVSFQNKKWDVSSRGTGVTCLAPGVVEAGKYLRTGSHNFGYGCGTADLDELIGSAILSEIFHRQKFNTERMLVIIDHGDGVGIGVRAAPNLIRPAHLFGFLRQGKLDPLKRATDLFLRRQIENQEWRMNFGSPQIYARMLDQIILAYARFSSWLERDYIFHWIDWDGDNLLANAGIIDYGSIRQFGLRHDQYRYDDVDRFSTNLNQQRGKTRLVLQQFVQLQQFLSTGTKPPLESLKDHPALKRFDQAFEYFLHDRFLYQCGFPEKHRDFLLLKHRPQVAAAYTHFLELETLKTRRRLTKVADGVNRPPRLNMRLGLKFLVASVTAEVSGSSEKFVAKDFYRQTLSAFALPQDRKPSDRVLVKISNLRNDLIGLFNRVERIIDIRRFAPKYREACDQINRDDRLTGNALIMIVWEMTKRLKRGLTHQDAQRLIEDIINYQQHGYTQDEFILNSEKSPIVHSLARTMLSLIDGYREDI